MPVQNSDPSGEPAAAPPSHVRRLLIAAREGLSPWDATPEARLSDVARQCGAAEVAEAIEEIAALSRERAELPAWDGDGQADIGRAQETHATILGQVHGALLPEIARGLGHADADTRRWLVLALERHGAPARPLLEEALKAEADESLRQWIGEALQRLGG